MKVYLALGMALAVGLCADSVRADLVVAAHGVAATVNFDGTVTDVSNGAFTGVGFQSSPTAGQLDSDSWAVTGWSNGNLAFGGTQTTASTDYTRGASEAAVTTGGIYGFDVDNTATVNRAFGVQPGGSDFAPGTITLRVQNGTGVFVNGWSASYTIYVRNDQARASSFNFSYSNDGINFTAVPALDLTSGEAAGVTTFVANMRSLPQFTSNVLAGGNLFLRWSSADVSGSGSRDEFGLDDVSIMAVVPEASPLALVGAAASVAGLGQWLRRRRSGRRIAG